VIDITGLRDASISVPVMIMWSLIRIVPVYENECFGNRYPCVHNGRQDPA
jgi:hypothetical protein